MYILASTVLLAVAVKTFAVRQNIQEILHEDLSRVDAAVSLLRCNLSTDSTN